MAGENGPTISGDGNQATDGSGKPEIGNIFGDGTPIFAPGDAVEAPGEGAGGAGPQPGGKRGRGRPRGSKNSGGKTGTTNDLGIDLDGLEKLLLSIHLGLAMLTKVPEFMIDQSEARLMGAAVARVSRHYPGFQKINASAMDHMNLATVMLGIYGTRFMAHKIRTVSEKAKSQRPSATVHEFPGPGLRPDGNAS